MTIELMRYTNAANSLRKSTVSLATVSGYLRGGASVQDPAIVVEGDITMRVASCNYFHIPEFGRYYYVNGMTSISTKLWELSGHVDVLYSFASTIEECTGIVQRQERDFNLYLDDGIFKSYQDPLVFYRLFPNSMNEPSFALVLAGSQD